MSAANEKIDQIEYGTIIMYLYLKGLLDKKIYEDTVNIFHDDYPVYATVKH